MKRHAFRFLLWVSLSLLGAGCSPPISVYGLRPEYPELSRNTFDNDITFVGVDSLQPTLKWEPFTKLLERADRENLQGRIGAVTYDLQIWRGTFRPVELVYEQRGLEHPWHKLAATLQPSTRYFWTVRARFELDGDYRVTEWGKLREGLRKTNRPRRSNIVPDPDYYRFETPASES